MNTHYFVQLSTGLIIESPTKISYNDKLNCHLEVANISTNLATISKHSKNIVFNLSEVVISWEKDPELI
jgi:hypothetical protein